MGKAKTASAAMDRIRANIQGETQSKKINEWSTDDDEFIIYWQPITLADKQKIQKHARGDDQQTTIYTLIFLSMDEAGKPLFTIADKIPLMTQIGGIPIEAVALEMLGVGGDIDAGN